MSIEVRVKVIPDIVGLIIKGAITNLFIITSIITETEISITYGLCGDFVIVISLLTISIILVMKNTLDSILKQILLVFSEKIQTLHQHFAKLTQENLGQIYS